MVVAAQAYVAAGGNARKHSAIQRGMQGFRRPQARWQEAESLIRIHKQSTGKTHPDADHGVGRENVRVVGYRAVRVVLLVDAPFRDGLRAWKQLRRHILREPV